MRYDDNDAGFTHPNVWHQINQDFNQRFDNRLE